MVVWKCHPLHLRLSLLVGVATFVLLYIHILHHGSEVTEMLAEKPTHKPVYIDHDLLQKYRSPKAKSLYQRRELLKCAEGGKFGNVTAEKCLITYITNPGWMCPGDFIRIGPTKRDGGWSACVSPRRGFVKPCVVFSFGISNMWQFDDVISEEHGCVVHAFDPSIRKSHHTRGKRIHFYDVGLGKADQLNFPVPNVRRKTWPMLTFKSMLSMLQLTHTPVNMVKMDIELGELEALPLMARDGSLDNVAQLIVEIHLPGHAGTKDIPFSSYVDVFSALEEANFALYFTRPNPFAIPTRIYGKNSYFEMHFFNKVFIRTLI